MQSGKFVRFCQNLSSQFREEAIPQLGSSESKTFLTGCCFFKSNLRSVFALRRLREEHSEFLVIRLLKFCGANASRDLKTIVSESFISILHKNHPCSCTLKLTTN